MAQYRIETNTGETIVEAPSPWAALGIHRKRGPNGLGQGWEFVRQSSGWIVATNKNDKAAEKRAARLKEVNWNRSMMKM